MAETDLSTALPPAPTESHSQLAVKEAHGNQQETNPAPTYTAEMGTRREVHLLNEVRPDYRFAECFADCPATDTFHDESIARWPAITCSELGSERIRLVRITPGPPGSMIECEVSTFFLKRAPDYTAVSYTWGSPLGFREILIQGRSHSVPKNLWRFLDQARILPGLTRLAGWLWIDALSINQSDPQEKLDQVGIISDIFKKAEHVIVWLGPSYADSDHALAALHVVRARRHRRNSRTVPGPVWSALHNLCERPYWRRLWVYQELKSALCTQLMCGNKLFSLRDFQDYMFDTAARRLEEKLEILRTTSAGMMLRLIGDPAEASLLSLIRNTSHLRCADPRDRAYAVFNIAQTGKQGMTADYTITTPVLLNRILENMQDMIFPSRWERVAEQCAELERLFGEPPNSMFPFSMEVDRYSDQSEGNVDFDEFPPGDIAMRLGEWCDVYSHRGARRLLPPDTESCIAKKVERSQRGGG